VALARALTIGARVLLLDEPLSALDAKVRADCGDQIRALQQRLMITTVFVTHDQEEALSMADRVCVMSRGRAEQIATPAELYSKPSTEFVAQFVGISSRVAVDANGDSVGLFGREVKIAVTCPKAPNPSTRSFDPRRRRHRRTNRDSASSRTRASSRDDPSGGPDRRSVGEGRHPP